MVRPTPEVDAALVVSRSEPEPSTNKDAPYPFGPTTAEITRFRDHVRATGQPETFPTICRTPPPAGSRPIYLARFSVDRRKRPNGDDAPCAICSPFHPKFVTDGYLIWYPDEGVIRAVGPDCGDAMFGGNQYAAAKADFNLRQRENDALEFLEKNLPKVAGMIVPVSDIRAAAVEAGMLYSAFKNTAPAIHERLRVIRKSGGILKVAVVTERLRRDTARKLDEEDDDGRVEGPRGLGRAGSGYDSYEVVLGQLPDSPILNAQYSPVREWDELFELVHALPRTNNAEEAVFWVADHADKVDQMEALVASLRRCAELYVKLSDRLDRVAQFFSESLFRSLDAWGRHVDNEFQIEASTDGRSFTFERDAFVIGAGWERRERERVTFRPDMEKLRARGQWRGFE